MATALDGARRRAAQALQAANAPVFTGAEARVLADGERLMVSVGRKQVDLNRLCAVRSEREFLVAPGGVEALGGVPREVGSVAAAKTSPSGQLEVRVRASKGKEDDLWLEVWRAGEGLVSSLKVGDTFSRVYSDAIFGGIVWNKAESKCCFVAERVAPKAFRNYYEELAKDDGGNGDDSAKTGTGGKPKPWFEEKYAHKQDFGETLEDKVDPVVFLFDVEANALRAVAEPRDGRFPMSPLFDQNDNIVFLAVSLPNSKLGLNFCFNRATGLFWAPSAPPADGEDLPAPTRLTPADHYLAFAPRFSPDFSRLVFFGRKEPFKSHTTVFELFCIEWASAPPPAPAAPSTVIGRFQGYPEPEDAFAGLYGYHASFTAADFVGQSSRLFAFQSVVRGRQRIYTVDLETCETRWCNFMGKEEGQYELLHVKGDTLVFAFASVNDAPKVFAATFAGGDAASPTPSPRLLDAVAEDDLRVAQHVVKLDNGAEGYLMYDAAREGEQLPCALIIHGGPFGSSPRDSFINSRRAMMRMGLAILVVNYRGSVGYGEDFLNALLGNIGVVDVADCAALTRAALEAHPEQLDPARVGVYGGSHGGFLTGWLIGHPEHRELFRASVLWNPVLEMAYMLHSTDIPDWCLACTADKPFPPYELGPADYQRLFEASPMSVVANVTCPTLLLVGTHDLRVPPRQAVYYHHALRDRGVPSQLFAYPDSGHAIANTEHNVDATTNLLTWFAEHLLANSTASQLE